MPHIHSKSSRPVTAMLVLVFASLALAACGGSSSTSSTTSTNASATTPVTRGRAGAASGGFAALRECLKKAGITLPTRKPGQAPGIGGFLGAGGSSALPKGVTKAQNEAAVKKCGGFPRGGFPRGGFRGRAGGLTTAASKHALAKFASCMRSNGVNVPAPNTSGNGPVFNDKGINTTSAKFKQAAAKCRSALLGIFRARPHSSGASPGAAPSTPSG